MISRRQSLRVVLSAMVVAAVAGAAAQVQRSTAPTEYFPPAGDWQKRDAASAGFDKAKLDDAVAFAVAHENPNTHDLAVDIPNSYRGEAPYNNVIGPTQTRAGANGVIIHHGAVIAEWGDTARADMTFSVTKTFLSTVVGLAYDRHKIRDLNDRVATYMPKGVDLFASEHNAPITWDNLLRQTSDWSGTLWGKSDWTDRPPRGQTPEQWQKREMHAPGTFWKYNDTRVNVLALSALYVYKRPLPEVLKASIFDPIGASTTWHWEGYDTSWIDIDGKRMQSVSGGGHFGGGMFINAWDMARFGYLFLHHGTWGSRQLISEKWMSMARTPTPVNPGYGFCNWYLNNPNVRADGTPGPVPFSNAPRSAVTFQGNGENVVYVDWDHDLVFVMRWVDNSRSVNEFIGKVLAAIAR